MEYRVLGKTGLRISRMGFGGIPIQRIDAEGTRQLMQALVESGVNYIDTARGYTVSEEYLGYALEGIRDKFVLATKGRGLTREAMAADIQTSLRNLRTDYIDLYQFHNPTMADLDRILAPGGAMEAMKDAAASGIVRHIGITTHSMDVFRRALELPWVETIMFPYNIVESQGKELVAQCAEKNIGFICMKPLAGGAIEDGTLAMRYLAADDHVTVVIPGMAELREIAENAAAMENTAPLTSEELTKIEQVRSALGTQFCRRCNYCAPCTVGIPIPNVFLMEGYLSRYGLKDWAVSRYEALPHPASECIECGVCETRCPYQLPIRQMLKAASQKFGK